VTEAERAMLMRIVEELYDQFVDIVDEGRPELDRDGVLRAATGAIYTASRARELGLVDEIGDREAAMDWLEQRLGKEVTVVEQRRRLGFADLLFGAKAAGEPASAVERLFSSTTGPRFLYYWQGGR
jgi:protease-4